MIIFNKPTFISLTAFAESAAEEYSQKLAEYRAFGEKIKVLVEDLLKESTINIHTLNMRVKSVESYLAKAGKPDPNTPTIPKYLCPLEQIEDKVGIRVVTNLLTDVSSVGDLISREFEILSTEDKTQKLSNEGRFGYQSIHYIAKLNKARKAITEYQRYSDFKCEIQIRTILQHAWAAIEHDLGYKTSGTKPDGLSRSFLALSGVLELADREFQRLKDLSDKTNKSIQDSIERNESYAIDITLHSLKYFLEKEFGDDKIDDDVILATIDLLKNIGYQNILRNYSAGRRALNPSYVKRG